MNHLKYNLNILKSIKGYNLLSLTCDNYPLIKAIELTNSCTMSCIMCPRSKMKRKVGFMDLDLFKQLIDEAKGYTNLIGLELWGDSILHPKFDEAVNYMATKGILSQISTNPVNLNDKIIKKIVNSKLDILVLSLDGIDDKTYKHFRGPYADYTKAELMIGKLLKAKKGSKPFITIRMLNMPGLGEHFNEFKKKWSLPGIDQIKLGPFCSQGNTIKNGGKDWINDCVCFRPWEGVYIMWDGRVTNCIFDLNGDVIFGDVNKESIIEIWNNEKMQDFRLQCINNKFDNKLCRNCNEHLPKKNLLKNFINYAYQRFWQQ